MQGYVRTQNIQPARGNSTVFVPVTTAANSPAVAAPPPLGNYTDYEVTNAGSNTAFLVYGDVNSVAPVIATAGTPANGYPILSGQTKVISAGRAQQYFSAITPTGTTTLYITQGQGS